MNLSPRGASVPQLIIVGSADSRSGTQGPHDYFRRRFDRCAPCTFVVQNETPHGCTINAKSLVLTWLSAAAVQRVRATAGLYGFADTTPSRTADCPQVDGPA